MILSVVFSLLTLACQGAELTVVRVEQGLLRGAQVPRSTGNGMYTKFKGIPYAEPPVGKLRFKAPQPPLPWIGIRNATDHGPVCPQLSFTKNEFTPGNEDCLTLNVYSPNMTPDEPLPVMVYIHGGGFKSGSGNDDEFGPDFLMDHEVILVTLNYRLGMLGFLSLDIEEVPGNAGMKDQVAAMKWVNRNIQQFGGDSNKITVIGESVGGTAVTLLAVSPMSQGLFKRGIAMSGVFLSDFARSIDAKRHAFQLCAELGFYTQDPHEAFKFLQNASVEAIVKNASYVLLVEAAKGDVTEVTPFTPVIENDFGGEQFLIECPEKRLREGKINDVDLMVGYTSQEGIISSAMGEETVLKYYSKYRELFLPTKIIYNRNTKEILPLADRVYDHYIGNQLVTINTMKEVINFVSSLNSFDTYRFVETWPRNKNIYFYEFSCYSDRNYYGKYGLKYGVKAASHMDDLMYVFDGKMFNLTIDKQSDSYKMITQTCKLFTNFAKYGNPTPDDALGVTWEEYKSNQSYLNINLTLNLNRVPENSEFHFWRTIFEAANLTYV